MNLYLQNINNSDNKLNKIKSKDNSNILKKSKNKNLTKNKISVI